MRPAMESRYISMNDVGFHLKDWKPEAGHNILLVTGLSGSGKTTLAKHLAKRPNHVYIELDWLDNFVIAPHKDNPVWCDMEEMLKDLYVGNPWEADIVRRIEMLEKWWPQLKAYCAKHPKNMYIVEGIHIVDLMKHGYVKGGMRDDCRKMPIIIKGTSAATSMWRARRRNPDAYTKSYLTTLVEWLGYDRPNRKFMADLLATSQPDSPSDFGIYD